MAGPITSKKLNQSPHTLRDLQRFAKASPEQAAAYLSRVEQELRALGEAKAAALVKKVLAGKTGTLAERVARLDTVFPETAKDWSRVQNRRVATMGWNAADGFALKTVQHLTGRVGKNEQGLAVLKTEGGRELRLAPSELRLQAASMPIAWMEGLLGDGPITLQGTPTEDRKGFNVEGFALNLDGRFDTFTYARVMVPADGKPAYLATPRGAVAIADPELLKKLTAMPRLGVILPGEPLDGVYQGNPAELFALARFRETSASGTGETRTVLTDMAQSTFANKPAEIPAEYAKRVNHSTRMWFRGALELGPDGTAQRFKASYVSEQTDANKLKLSPTARDADAVQAAVMLEAP